EGRLTDHYNPLDKTVNLSPEVFSGRSVASAAIAAHECGHAVQHADAYQWLELRSKVVPTVSFMGKWVPWVLMGGALLAFASPYLGLAVIALGIVFYGAMSIFSLITLPVEFDASARALRWLESSGMTAGSEHDMAKDALKWAALTYVIAAVGMIVNLLYYINLLTGRSRD
ncbi:MAG TPA: zinc metallopeptidase, partial [Chitinophagales bacterium]